MSWTEENLPPKLRAQLDRSEKEQTTRARTQPEKDMMHAVMGYTALTQCWTTHIPTSIVVDSDGGMRHVTTYQGDSGLPDLIIGYDGRTLLLELKVVGNRPTRHQQKAIEALGGYWTDDIDLAFTAVDRLKAGTAQVFDPATRKLVN